MKVLILANYMMGLMSFRREILEVLCAKGYEVLVSAPYDKKYDGQLESLGCLFVKTNVDRRGMNPVKDMQLLINYYKIIRQYKPDVVLSYTIKPNVYGGFACRLTRTPLLANITGLGDAIENGGLIQKLTIFLYKMGIGKAQMVFFQNKYNRQFCIEKGITTDGSTLLPGSGVNLTHHKYQEYPDDGVVKFLYIGRLLKDKGIEEYMEAAKRIKKKNPNTEFQILGNVDEQYQAQLDELVSMGIINYLGVTSDVRPYLKKVHCTIMPSYHEGMSNVNLESAANGRPVITSNVPGCIETIDDGVTGFLCEAKSTDSLTTTIDKFLSLSYEAKKEMGVAGRLKVEREFDRKTVVNKYLDEIEKIAKGM